VEWDCANGKAKTEMEGIGAVVCFEPFKTVLKGLKPFKRV